MKMNVETLYSLGTTLVFVGILIVIIAAALILFSGSRKTGNVKAGGAIIIGPVPIVFGTDKKSLRTALFLSIVLTALLIILTVTLHFLSK